MAYSRYVTRRRARFKAICGQVNIPYGTVLHRSGDYLLLHGQQICTDTSKNAHDFFSHDDDGYGGERGKLVGAITSVLDRRDAARNSRWEKVWNSGLCQRYRRPEHEEVWLWNHDFYNAPVADLRHIAGLVGANVR